MKGPRYELRNVAEDLLKSQIPPRTLEAGKTGRHLPCHLVFHDRYPSPRCYHRQY
jgi:hypothetical protein